VVPPATRYPYLDNLKTLMIAGIIAGHAVVGYATFSSWTYQDVQEATISPAVELVFAIAMFTFGALFLMQLFFLISGLLTQDSLARKSSSRFVRDRLLRLGVPFVAYTLVVWPLLEYALLEPILHRGSYWHSFTNSDPVLDNGPMWFVGVLLLFSLALVAWRRLVPPRAPDDTPLSFRYLLVVAGIVSVATFLVRTVMPADSNQPLNVHMWGWPAYVAMFALGVSAARHGWLRPVERALSRRCGVVTALAMVAMATIVLVTEPLGLTPESFYGGWGLPPLVASVVEGLMAVCAPIWVLAVAQRHLNGSGRLRRAAARGSYLAFMLQGPVLVALALALRPTMLSGDLKALLVAVLGVVGSFAIAWPLVTRTPLGRVL
jgi:fucose 4-O-acetylase-like acetyltransferase